MQTEGKININNKKMSHKDKIKIVERQSCFTSVNNSHYHDCRTLHLLGMRSYALKSSVLSFCASRCIAMFQIICHTGTSREIDRKTNNYSFEYLNNLGCLF